MTETTPKPDPRPPLSAKKMANLRQGDFVGYKIWQGHPNRLFSEISQRGNQGKLLKYVGYKNDLPQIASSPNMYALKVQTSQIVLLQTAAAKVPTKQSYGKFGNDTLIAHFLRFSERRTKSNSSKMMATKTPWRKSHHLLITMHLKCKHYTTFCCKPRLQKCP